jgi:hypothetical protein
MGVDGFHQPEWLHTNSIINLPLSPGFLRSYVQPIGGKTTDSGYGCSILPTYKAACGMGRVKQTLAWEIIYTEEVIADEVHGTG